MLFNSYQFILVFLPATLGVYLALVRRGHRARALDWLVLASLVFYGWWRWTNLPLLAGSLAFNYAVGTALGRPPRRAARARVLLATGVAVNLAFLGYFKYANFLRATVNEACGTQWPTWSIVLPLGISFYTFQIIAYLVDSYHGRTRGYGFRDFSLFVCFFPQLIAGPIVHHGEVMPQFRRPNLAPQPSDLALGTTLFVLGLAKKVLLADTFSGWATPTFDAARDGATLGFAAAWTGTAAYTLQIYFDFSAYSDMAIGLGRLFGIRLPLNFNSPYQATNIAEFWHRWHLTLSRFLRDYLYIPLGGNRRGPVRRVSNLMLTMLLGGLWHGAGWTFIIWGALHGLYLCLHHGWRQWRERAHPHAVARPTTRLGGWAGRLATVLAVMIAWVFFRADSWTSALVLLEAMAGLNGFALEAPIALSQAVPWVGVCFLAVWFLPNSQEFVGLAASGDGTSEARTSAGGAPAHGGFARAFTWRPNTACALLLALLTVGSILGLTRASEFIYWQF